MWLVKHSVNMAEMRAFSIPNTKKKGTLKLTKADAEL